MQIRGRDSILQGKAWCHKDDDDDVGYYEDDDDDCYADDDDDCYDDDDEVLVKVQVRRRDSLPKKGPIEITSYLETRN